MVVSATATTVDPGPAAGPWHTAGALDAEGRRLDLMVVAGTGPARYAVLAEPRVRRVSGGGRLFSATLIAHDPDTDAGTVDRVVLTFDIDTAPPVVALESLRETSGTTHLALFARRTTVRLVDTGTGRVLGTGSAPTGTASLTCTLDGPAARAAHDAIAGRPGPLEVRTELAYRVAGDGQQRAPRLRFDIAAVHDLLDAVAAGAPLPSSSLAGHLRDLILAGVVRVEPPVDGRTATGEVAAAALPAFLRAVGPVLRPIESGEFAVGDRPTDGRWVETGDPPGVTGRVEQRVTLERLVGEVLRGGPSAPYVRVLSASGSPITPGVRVDPASAPMVTAAGRITTRWNAVRPQPVDPGPDAHALLAATAGTADPTRAPRRWSLPDGVLAPPGPGPVVDGGDLWPDRTDPGVRWYAPGFEPASLAVTETTGVLTVVAAVVPNGSPGVAMSPGVPMSPGGPMSPATPVPLEDLSGELHLPYRDAHGRTRTAAIPASGVRAEAERIEFTFAVDAAWAGAARTALAGGAGRPARLSVAYTFTGWAVEAATPVLGPMTLLLPVVSAPDPDARGTTVDADSGVIRFADGAALPPRERPGVAVHATPAAVAPEPTRHVRLTHGRTVTLDLFAAGLDAPPPAPTGPVYEEVPVAAAPTGTVVLRVRAAPGRFVLVPAAYTITRHGPEEGARAYRPALAVHGTVDPPRCLLGAGLHPDLTPAQRHAIAAELRALHPAPVLEHVTAVWADADVRWERAVATVRSPEGFQIGIDTDGAGAAPLESALVTGGVRGRVTFTLGDGTTVASELVLDLARISGPWSGPVATGLAADRSGPQEVVALALTNRIEAPVAVADVLVPGVPGATVPVERVLEPGTGLVVRVPPGSVGHLVASAVRAAPTGLSDLRANVDEVVFDVVFLNLTDPAGLVVTARPVGGREERTVALPPGTAAGALTLTLPVTAFLAGPAVEYRVRRSAAGTTGAWHTWDLTRHGHVVALTRERVD
jgi:hypothetical protein